MPYKGLFMINQCCKNGIVILQCGAIKIRYNICRLKPHTFNTDVQDVSLRTNYLQRCIRKVLVIYFCIMLKLGKSI